MQEVVLDTETTGLSVKDGHRIVEIGCIEIDNLIPTSKKFHCYLNPERKVSEKALEVHGYTDKFLSDKKKFKEIVDEFLKFIDGKKLVIHNAEFDIAHLNNELEIVGKKKIEKKNIIDTLDIARDKFPGSQISLDALCKRYNVDNSSRDFHGALLDERILGDVYLAMTGGQTSFALQDNDEYKKINNKNISTADLAVIEADEEELRQHQELCNKIDEMSEGSCIWKISKF